MIEKYKCKDIPQSNPKNIHNHLLILIKYGNQYQTSSSQFDNFHFYDQHIWEEKALVILL